jgi:ABC-type transporter Mla MlaB component
MMRLELRGPLNRGTATALRAQVVEALNAADDVILDFVGVEVEDQEAVGALLQVISEGVAAGKRIRLRNLAAGALSVIDVRDTPTEDYVPRS